MESSIINFSEITLKHYGELILDKENNIINTYNLTNSIAMKLGNKISKIEVIRNKFIFDEESTDTDIIWAYEDKLHGTHFYISEYDWSERTWLVNLYSFGPHDDDNRMIWSEFGTEREIINLFKATFK